MGKTHVDNLQAGMVLTEDVRDRSGRLLLGTGAELQDKHIKIFRTWGVSEAAVDDEYSDNYSSGTCINIAPDDLANMEESLKPRFRHADLTHPAMEELLRLNALQRLNHGLS